jgi:hypothetical protein
MLSDYLECKTIAMLKSIVRYHDAECRAQFVVLIFSVALWFNLVPHVAYACAPTIPPLGVGIPTAGVADYVAASNLIVNGQVSEVREPQRSNESRIAVIQVRSYLKGHAAATLEVGGFGYGPDCRAPIQVGESGIFYLNYRGAGRLEIVQLEAYHAYDPHDATTVAEITNITGQQAEPVGDSPPGWRAWNMLVFWCVVGGSLIGGLGMKAIWKTKWFARISRRTGD